MSTSCESSFKLSRRLKSEERTRIYIPFVLKYSFSIVDSGETRPVDIYFLSLLLIAIHRLNGLLIELFLQGFIRGFYGTDEK